MLLSILSDTVSSLSANCLEICSNYKKHLCHHIHGDGSQTTFGSDWFLTYITEERLLLHIRVKSNYKRIATTIKLKRKELIKIFSTYFELKIVS